MPGGQTSSPDAQPPDPPKDLVSSDRVHLLTSWKLWLAMLFVSLLLMAAAFLWTPYRRMRALDLIETRKGSYTLGESPCPWVTNRLGRLGLGFQPVDEVHVNAPIGLSGFERLAVLSEAKSITVTADRVTLEWAEVAADFPHLQDLCSTETSKCGPSSK